MTEAFHQDTAGILISVQISGVGAFVDDGRPGAGCVAGHSKDATDVCAGDLCIILAGIQLGIICQGRFGICVAAGTEA